MIIKSIVNNFASYVVKIYKILKFIIQATTNIWINEVSAFVPAVILKGKGD